MDRLIQYIVRIWEKTIEFCYSRARVYKRNLTGENFKQWILLQFTWQIFRKRLNILVAALLIASFVTSSIGPNQITQVSDVEARRLEVLHITLPAACVVGIGVSMGIYYFKHQGWPETRGDWVYNIGIGCGIGVAVHLLAPAVVIAPTAVLGHLGLEATAFTLDIVAHAIYDQYLEVPFGNFVDGFFNAENGTLITTSSVRNDIGEIKKEAENSAEVNNAVGSFTTSLIASTGDPLEVIDPFDIIELDVGYESDIPYILTSDGFVIAHVIYPSGIKECHIYNPEQDINDRENLVADIKYIQFGYSYTKDQNNVQLMPSINHVDSKDAEGCDNWMIDLSLSDDFNNPAEIYIAARVLDVYDRLTPWYFSDQFVTVDPRYNHDYELSNIQFSPNDPNVSESVSVSATVTNVGRSDEISNKVSLYVDGSKISSPNISALDAGNSTTVYYNWVAQHGAHTLQITSELTNDGYEPNNTDSGMIVVGTVPQLMVSGSTNPSVFPISIMTDGGSGSFNVTLQNIGSEATTVSVSKSGTSSSWISLGANPGGMDPNSSYTFNFTVNVPSGQSVGTESASIDFSWTGGAAISLPIEFNIISIGDNVFEAQITKDPSASYTVNGSWQSTSQYRQPDFPYETRLDLDPVTVDPTSYELNFTLSESEYYRIKADSSNEWSIILDEIAQTTTSNGIYRKLNDFTQTYTADFTGSFDIYDDLIIGGGSNQLKLALTGYIPTDRPEWDIESNLILSFTQSAWWGEYNVDSLLYNTWSAGWDIANVCATIQSVTTAGDISLFNEGALIETETISGADVGDEICWHVGESEFELNNRFNFKANVGGANVTLSNVIWRISYFQGRPVVQATRSLPANKADVGEDIVVTLNFDNIGTNIADDISYNEFLPTGLNMVSGALSGSTTDLDPDESSTETYTIDGSTPGSYVIPGSVVTYFDPSGGGYMSLFNNTILEIWGGDLIPTLEAVDESLAGTPQILYATVMDALTATPVENAQVIAEITNPDLSTTPTALRWDGGLEKYKGTYTPTQHGLHTISVYASKPFYIAGSSVDPTEWIVRAPNQEPVADGSYIIPEGGGLDIILNGAGSLDINDIIESYEWDIGNDGSVDVTGRRAEWTFPANGTYTVKLTVTDHYGAFDEDIFDVIAGSVSMDIEMNTGWNLTSLPFDTPAMTAEDVCTSVGSPLVEVDRWYAGGWDPHICGLTFNDFPLELGQGYFGRMGSNSTWTVIGTAVQDQILLDLVAGWNLISLPSGPVYTAEELGTEISNQGGICSEIDRWYAGGWDPHIIGLTFNDFNIESGQGYFIRCSGSSSVIITP